jgi:hypothetical protein
MLRLTKRWHRRKGKVGSMMNTFVGASRKEEGRIINNDAFAACGTAAFLLDGAANAHGSAHRICQLIRQQYRRMPLSALLKLLDTTLLGLGAECTLIAAEVDDRGYLTGMSCGDSVLHVIREGKLIRVTESTKPRLGTGHPDIRGFSFQLKRYDVVLAASDGLVLEPYRIIQTAQRNMLRASELPHALLQAQRDMSDDVTVLTLCVR